MLSLQMMMVGRDAGIVKYSDLPIPHIIYMDDSNNFAEDVKSAQERIRKIEDMLESKLLNINLEKTNFIVFGAKNSRKMYKETWKQNLSHLEMRS